MSFTNDPEPSQGALVPHTYQGALIQQRLNDGFINATAMCKAAGKEWANYNQNATTKDFLAELQGSLGIPRDLVVQSVVTGPNEQRGTWVHPQVAIHLAQWLSPAFAVLVSQWVFEWLSGHKASDKVWQQFEDRVSLVYDNVPVGYFCIFREIADIFATIFSKGIDPGTRMILDISVGLAWANCWREKKLAAKHGERATFPHYYPNYFTQSFSNLSRHGAIRKRPYPLSGNGCVRSTSQRSFQPICGRKFIRTRSPPKPRTIPSWHWRTANGAGPCLAESGAGSATPLRRASFVRLRAMSDRKPGHFTGGWFQQQTDEQLQAHLDGGGPGNTAYEGAMREIQRRAVERGSAEQMLWIKRTFWAALAIGVAGVAATILFS